MAELKFSQLVIFGSSGTVADFNIDGQKATVKLLESEEAEIRAVAFRAYERNRQALADAILTAQPLALGAPKVEYAEFEVVKNLVDDEPF